MHICTILQENGLDNNSTFASIVNIAVDGGIGKISYEDLLALNEEQQRQVIEQNIVSFKRTLEPIDIDILTRRGKTVDKLKKQAEELGVDIDLIKRLDIRNINIALKIIEEYDFEKAIGRSLIDVEQKILIESLMTNSQLEKGNGGLISTLVKNLQNKGMTQEEVYGAVINYAIGNGRYSEALMNSRLFAECGKEEIATEITESTINQMLLNNGVQLERNTRKLECLGITTKGINEKNVDSAIKIVEEYDFKKAIGRSLTDVEQKILIELLIANSALKKENSCLISTLVKNLQDKGMSQEEAYGAVINYAIGNGNYSYALANEDSFSKKGKQEIVTEITEDKIKQMIFENDIQIPKNTGKLNSLGITTKGINEKNVDSAIKIVEEYDFKKAIGRSLTDVEQKILIELLIANSQLKEKNGCLISTLVKNLRDKGMSQVEAYGAVINYAIGNGRYSEALLNNRSFAETMKEEIATEITEGTINQVLLNNGIQLEKNTTKLEGLGIQIAGAAARNVDSAIKIVEEYDFEKAIGRSLTDVEQKILIELLIANSTLKEGNYVYISKLLTNLREKGMDRDEAYGAVINYAIGNGNYTKALGNMGAFVQQSKEEIATEVSEVTLNKAAIKHQKMALKFARACVSKETVERKDETLQKLNGLVIETESQSVAQKE